ncbi:ATP-dependent RecD-like DNA helicase [bacterium]|nr:ATP-dependent RecD-like DNA helicase [bacterium]
MNLEQKRQNDKATDAQQSIRGIVERVTYFSADTGYHVLKVSLDFPIKEIAVVGYNTKSITPGVHILAHGSWIEHPKFGKQFKASSIVDTPPPTKEGLIRYLGAGQLKGIGPVLAERIVDHFGTEALNIIESNPQRLAEVPGIGRRKAEELVSEWESKRSQRESLLFFTSFNIPIGTANRIIKHFKANAIKIVKENPYQLVSTVWGIGFKTADRIAQLIGIDPSAAIRLRAGLAYTLKRASEEGHLFLTQEILLAKAQSVLGFNDAEILSQELENCVSYGEVIRDYGRLYLPQLHTAEKGVSEFFESRLKRNFSLEKTIPTDQVNSIVAQSSFSLSEDQHRALQLVANQSAVLITGGPGCGKTTVVKTIVELFKRARISFKLAAPTGRAAQRLAEVCEEEASTVHRLLKYDPFTNSFVHNQHHQLPCEALIIDECSMVDIPLAANLLAAVSDNTRLILVGDADQLPSVGPGLFFADLLSVPAIPQVRLSRLFRRSAESEITEIAHSINNAVIPNIQLLTNRPTATDSFFVAATGPEHGSEIVTKLISSFIPEKFNFSPQDISVLTPTNQGPLGVIALNQTLQAALNPKQHGGPTVRVGNIEYRVGDRVCQRANNYDLGDSGVFNGDQGYITAIDPKAESIDVKLWDGRLITYPAEHLSELDLAYAITIHRSQGSEMPVVVMTLHDSHAILLERQLIYTGITRAKRLLIIVGTKRALAMAIKRERSKKRMTLLPERIQGLKQKVFQPAVQI